MHRYWMVLSKPKNLGFGKISINHGQQDTLQKAIIIAQPK